MKILRIPKTRNARQVFRLCWLLALVLTRPLSADSIAATPEEIHRLLRKPCAILHLWAGWCSICLEEFPELIPWFNGVGAAERVVVDVSEADVAPVAERWLEAYRPQFQTYKKTSVAAAEFLHKLDKDLNYFLPYTAIFKNGKKIFEVYGRTPIPQIDQTIQKSCPKPTLRSGRSAQNGQFVQPAVN